MKKDWPVNLGISSLSVAQRFGAEVAAELDNAIGLAGVEDS
jgi:hypothetical protein